MPTPSERSLARQRLWLGLVEQAALVVYSTKAGNGKKGISDTLGNERDFQACHSLDKVCLVFFKIAISCTVSRKEKPDVDVVL